ncbi:TPA: Abi family protein [Streptococcus agalactiae]|uniref:Abi family protein n=1 Tax=Streptococcus agalactiae TaxID=1311 RepID=UPI0002B98705|nr:Abi family protein [Streptococcus agalactiae]EPT39813.1 hypothetical protein SAG0030_04035 [Streptococcus agalactiae FSL S3-603]EPT90593.1 hypothetical protein SAG0104_04575 [Streptococcus agalactiae BSU178]EPV90210.1 hypothetical protein SAG0014_11070 [Streptococcus agalactiae FSL S3-586]MCQ3827082.1 Abi family protein [Streptococcus agalactiae]SUN02088.1 abortive infection bacteriophage resistance protein [Streptococcus agalactiae]
MKPFHSIDEQLVKLDSRNLIILDRQKAYRYLLTNNYYNVINGYSKFLLDKDDMYMDGATFEEVTCIHWYDKEIKAALLTSIIEAEKHFKSVVAYRFSEKFQDAYSYLNISNFETNGEANKISKIAYLISIMARIIKDKTASKQNNAIKHHINKHKSIPFWVLVNELTFGQIYNFYVYLDNDIKDKIARDLSSFLQSNIENRTRKTSNQIISGNTLVSILRNVIEVRNITAHNNKIFGFTCRENLPKQKWFIDSDNKTRQSVYYAFQSLQCLLSRVQYSTLHNTILSRSNRLDNKLHTITSSEINRSLGFPTDWQINTEKLKQ